MHQGCSIIIQHCYGNSTAQTVFCGVDLFVGGSFTSTWCNIFICNQYGKINSSVLCQYNHTFTIHFLWHFIILITKNITLHFKLVFIAWVKIHTALNSCSVHSNCKMQLKVQATVSEILPHLQFTRKYSACLSVVHAY